MTRCNAADWLYVCDADEFLMVKVGDGGPRFGCGGQPTGRGDIVPWRVFGPDGRRDYADHAGDATIRFGRADGAGLADQPIYAKSLFRGWRIRTGSAFTARCRARILGRALCREMPGGVRHVATESTHAVPCAIIGWRRSTIMPCGRVTAFW